MELAQRGRGRVDGVTDTELDRRDLAIEAAHIGEQLAGEALAFTCDQTLGMHAAQQFRRPISA